MGAVYPNLINEMARQDITVTDMAKLLNVSQATIYRRLNGKSDFLLREAVKICQYFDNENAAELFLRLDSNSNKP